MSPKDPKARFVALGAVHDGPLDEDVVRVGANFARIVPGGELHLIYVIEDLPTVTSVPVPYGLGLTLPELAAARRKHLDELATHAQSQFAGRIVGHLAAGSAYKQILQMAIDLQADVVLVGTHGRKGIKRMLIGSVAEAVVRRASCPVIVVRPKDYHAFVPPEIEPACPDCVSVQQATNGDRLWCERHSQHHPRAHVYYELPQTFGLGSQLMRPE